MDSLKADLVVEAAEDSVVEEVLAKEEIEELTLDLHAVMDLLTLAIKSALNVAKWVIFHDSAQKGKVVTVDLEEVDEVALVVALVVIAVP